jgi:hypothetical protein
MLSNIAVRMVVELMRHFNREVRSDQARIANMKHMAMFRGVLAVWVCRRHPGRLTPEFSAEEMLKWLSEAAEVGPTTIARDL